MSTVLLNLAIDRDETSAATTRTTTTKQEAFILYPHRWSVLASFTVLSASSSWMWITWSPITLQVAELWKVSHGAVDALAGVYLYIYVPCSFLSLYWVVTYAGLRQGLLAGALFNAAGAVLRYTGRNSYRSVYIGTLFAAVAQSFTLATPPLIAGHWFGASERGTATALGVLANQAGTALGLGVTCAVDFNRSNLQERLQVYLGVQAAVAAVAVLLVYIFVADHPPTPPSVATAFLLQSASTVAPHDCVSNTTEETYLLPPPRQEKMDDSSSYTKQIAPPNYWQSIRLVVGEWSSISFLLSFGMSVGVYYTLPTFFSQLLPHGDGTHWSFTVTGWLGVSYQLAGVLGSFVSGRLVDATQHYRAASLLLLGVAALSLLVFGVTASVAPLGSSRLAVAGFVLGVVGSGFSLAAWNTVGLEFGTSLSYPANEAAVAGILECAAELAGFLWVTIGGFLIETAHAEFLFVLVAAAGASFLLLGFNHTEAKRPR